MNVSAKVLPGLFVENGKRHFVVGRKDHAEPFPSNAISTTIYTPYNFVCKNLFKQFTRFSNVYYLIITCLQLLPQVTSSHGVPTMIVPLGFIITVSGVKDLIEDLQRHKSDEKQNQESIEKLHLAEGQQASFQQSVCASIRVGELVRIHQNDRIPADMILLGCSHSNRQCYVTTSNLDGESTLKPRNVPVELASTVSHKSFTSAGDITSEGIKSFCLMEIECDLPNRKLDKFKGTMIFPSKINVDLDISNLLLRGTQLRDTAWAVGLVVYTGEDTKVRQNASVTPIKRSWMYNFINQVTLYIVLVQVLVLIIAVVMQKELTQRSNVVNNPYVTENDSAAFIDYVWLFLAYMLLFSNFVPIALQVTIDFTRYFQILTIQQDRDMMGSIDEDKELSKVESKGVRVQSSELNEELGLIEHIFSDKTGTLTCNRMEFRSCHVDGKTLDFAEDTFVSSIVNTTPTDRSVRHMDSIDFAQVDRSSKMQRFLINLAINNSISPSLSESSQGQVEYSGTSPDERALVIAASHAGVILKRRDNASIILQVDQEERKYEILHCFEFTSDRKKSSIVCRRNDASIVLMCKGADSVILPALSAQNNSTKVFQAKAQMEVYCSNGLRVLCFGEREISQEYYIEWQSHYLKAREFAKRGDESELHRVISLLESELILVGLSGIEDKIQEGAAEALAKFREAGIKVWMLTGDRPDTATNVGYSVRLISNEMRLLKLVGNEWATSRSEALSFFLQEMASVPHSSMSTLHQTSPGPASALAMLIDDKSIEAIRAFKLEKEFMDLCDKCQSVLCARISPKQKELIVEMVRTYFPAKVTMAVGDGANDVPMIQRAHIGVGIAGEEGLQAADASDYSIPAFRHLQRLVFVHGRGMNRRISTLTLYIFYKNVLLVLPQFFYGIHCLYSGQSTYFDNLLQLFNVGFTSLPVLTYAIVDKDVSSRLLLSYPKLYQDGFMHVFLNHRLFWFWMLEATISSVLIMVVPVYLIPVVPWTHNGKDNDLWAFGLVQFFMVVFLASMRLMMEVSNNRLVVFGFILLSLATFWVVVWVFSSLMMFGREFYGVLTCFSMTNMILCALLCTICGCALPFLSISIQVFFSPAPRVICREIDYAVPSQSKDLETVFPLQRSQHNNQFDTTPDTSKTTLQAR